MREFERLSWPCAPLNMIGVVGKFLNSYTTGNLATPAPPAGWTNSSFLIDPYTYNYLQSQWTNKPNARTVSNDVTAFPNVHTTTVTERKALAMVDAAAAAGGQFFMMITGGEHI